MAINETMNLNDGAVIIPDDGAREASIGRVAELPTLGEALRAWEKQIAAEKPSDAPTKFNKLSMLPDGLLTRGQGGMRMTYRVFGGLLRDYCDPPRNVARCLFRLRTEHAEKCQSPRSFAVNDYYRTGRESPKKGEAEVWLRTRELLVSGRETGERVIVGQVTPSHSRAGSDDTVFIEKVRAAFAGELKAVRASFYRGIEVSELRAVIPAMRVETAPGEWWSGYVTVRNSEVGAASWSVSAGLYKELDEATVDAARRLGFEGATLSIEANEKVGVHTGKKVAMRAEEALTNASALLATLKEKAAELSTAVSHKELSWIVNRLAKAITRAASGELQEQLLGALAMQANAWDAGLPGLETSDVITFLGQAMVQMKRRGQTFPLERLAGQVLIHGIDTALEHLPEYTDVDADE